ncbi:hypothetical protein [Flavobacterium sp. 245]|uniref:hypothetical protein n=1 Tax=Flavobacterium sp. 245 TaxID=2512115 RepID=UPI00105F7D37|nr:hypothetical protein [Flavobacterium sp. 245]TDP02949.1 hypothetical protein EV145_102109 [Flavobacterium sp. 245]
MIRQISILGCLLLFLLFSNCKQKKIHPKLDYNTKANEVIKQLLKEESCQCILEIPTKSLIEIHKIEDLKPGIENVLIEKLHLKNRKELDSLVSVSNNFVLDTTGFKQGNIKVVALDSLRELAKDPNYCPKGILCVRKPIFDKNYQNVIVDYGYAFMCLSSPWAIYRFENGKWKR